MGEIRLKNVFIFLWILMLIFLAGMLNVYSIKFFGTTASHHTGNISNFAFQLYEKGTFNINLLYVIITFFVGGVIAGYILNDRDALLQESYGIISIICGLFVICLHFVDHYFAKLYAIVLMLGFQNGIFKKFNKVIIRTSHFTGYLTDAGIIFGKILRGDYTGVENLCIYLTSITSFVLGGFFSGYILGKSYECLVMIGCFYVIAGFYYLMINRVYSQNVNQINIVDSINESMSFEENI